MPVKADDELIDRVVPPAVALAHCHQANGAEHDHSRERKHDRHARHNPVEQRHRRVDHAGAIECDAVHDVGADRCADQVTQCLEEVNACYVNACYVRKN